MAQDSRFDRYQVLVNCAAIAAHANGIKDGFRHRDVRFLIELFSNWVDLSVGAEVLQVQNTQVSRYLERLVREGFARKTARKGYPVYRLTRIGLLELLGRVVGRSYWSEREQFFLLFSFIENYREKLKEIVKAEGSLFPVALQIELQELLNAQALLEREIAAARLEMTKLEGRIRDVERGHALTLRLLKQGASFEEVLGALERSHPYELNNEKPLSELVAQLPEGLREWELVQGQLRRQRQIFRPLKGMLESYIRELERLREKPPI